MKINVELNIRTFFKEVLDTYVLAIKKALKFITEHWLKSLIIVLSFVVLALFVSWTAAFFLSFFLAFLIMQLDNRVSIALALICLVSCPFLLIFHYPLVAEQFAIWAYYFLAIGVILQIVEFVREPKDGKIISKEKPVAKEERINRASEGIVLKPSVKKIPEGITLKKGLSWKTFLIIMAIVVFIVIATAGSIIYMNISNSSSSKGVSTEAPLIKKEEPKETTIPSEIDKAKITITVLNGNGIPGAAADLKKELEDRGFVINSTADADRSDYPETVIRYQPGSQKNAEEVAKALKGIYETKLEETVVSQDTEIVIVVGQK